MYEASSLKTALKRTEKLSHNESFEGTEEKDNRHPEIFPWNSIKRESMGASPNKTFPVAEVLPDLFKGFLSFLRLS